MIINFFVLFNKMINTEILLKKYFTEHYGSKKRDNQVKTCSKLVEDRMDGDARGACDRA